jgi:hypothetical protein
MSEDATAPVDPVSAPGPASRAGGAASPGAAPAGGARGAARRWAAVAPAVALAAIAVWEARAAIRAGSSVPDDAAWARAAAIVRGGYAPGDLIVFAPEWVDPVGRLHLGDLIPLDVAGRMDAARYGRIWELGIRGARAAETAGLEAREVRDAGGVVVRRLERAPVRVLADLRDRLPTARVAGTAAQGPRVALLEVGFAPRRCVLAVPVPGAPLTLVFPGLPAGELVGAVGIADVFTRRDERRPGRLAVAQGGRDLVAVPVGIDDGWARFSVRITAGEVALTLASAAPGRLLCFAAEVRP